MIAQRMIGAAFFAALPALGGCGSSTTYGTGQAPEMAVFSEMTGGLTGGKKNQEPINYQPRAPLVMPPDGQLQQPIETASAEGGPWPSTSNADAIGDRGTIRIVTRPVAEGVHLEFHDDGPGISKDVQSRIFDPFFTTKPVGVGTGLGLSLSHGIIERHDGRLMVESELGRGTTFIIELPLDAPPLED